MRIAALLDGAIVVITALVCTAHAGMYSESVHELTAANFDKLVMDTTETWLVKFYAPWCGHCQSSAPAFSKAAKKLEGVAKLGVVNCDDHSSLAQRFGVQGFPTLKVFKGEGKKARRPADYSAARSAKAFVDHVKYVMPSFVARVKPSGADAFFKDEIKLPHVLLFTDKTSTSPLYKGMSATFKGRVSFGEVRKADAGELVGKYSVSSYPTLIAFKAGENKSEGAQPFVGTMDPASLKKFFESIASGKEPEEGDVTAPGEDVSEKVFAQPKAYSGEVPLITGTKKYEQLCGSRKDGRMCGLAILPGGESNTLYPDLKPIAEQYQYDNMAFAVMDSSIEGGAAFASLFSIESDVGGFIVMRARKKKYASLEAEGAPSKRTIGAFLDRIVGGDARFKKLTEDLPEWVVEEDVSDASGEDGATKGNDTEQAESEEADSGESGQCGTEPPKDGESCGEPKEEL